MPLSLKDGSHTVFKASQGYIVMSGEGTLLSLEKGTRRHRLIPTEPFIHEDEGVNVCVVSVCRHGSMALFVCLCANEHVPHAYTYISRLFILSLVTSS